MQHHIGHMGKTQKGEYIRKSGGALKFRYSPQFLNVGKSGAFRVIYFIDALDRYIFLDVYAKSFKASLTDKEIKDIKNFITEFNKEISKGD